MAEKKSYKGSCHCGEVAYTVDADLSVELITCNCSICSRSGTMLAFVPASDFKLLQGKESLTDYQFGKKSLHHPFCSTCGIRSFSIGALPDGTEMRAINARCLEGVDLESLKTKLWDGAKI